MNTRAQTDNRFQSDAAKYAAYLDTPEGRLRLDLTLANLQEFLPAPQASRSLSALDLGCGTGAAAVRVAQVGFHVTLFDSSPAMLDIAERAALDAGVGDKVALKQGDAAQSVSLLDSGSFDLILCHNVLEYVDAPEDVLSAAARLLRNSSSMISVLVRNQAGEALKAAIQSGDLPGAQASLTAEWAQESLYGGKVRLFTLDHMRNLLKAAGLRMIAERGVRVVVDYLPPQVSRRDEYERILELERELGSRPEFVAIARYTHFLASRMPG
jgi:S-adenosylmethionine-dependent methyltransferase